MLRFHDLYIYNAGIFRVLHGGQNTDGTPNCVQALANYSHTYSDKDNTLWWPPTQGHIASYLNWKSGGVKVL